MSNDNATFISAAGLNSLANIIHKLNLKNGFWEGNGGEIYEIPRKLNLIHTEISEATDLHHKAPEGWEEDFVEELSDAVIRILDLAQHYWPGRIGTTLISKVNKNHTRPFKHGKRY